jgi:hypothetical protein
MERDFLFLGILYSCGSIKSKSRIEFQTKRKEFADLVYKIAKTITKPKIKTNKFYTISIVDKELTKKVGIINKNDLPIDILDSKEKIRNFLIGYFEGKSSISVKNKIIKISGKQKILNQLKELLKKLNIDANIYKVGNYYSLYIEGKNKCKTFKENIGFISSKKKTLLDNLILYY